MRVADMSDSDFFSLYDTPGHILRRALQHTVVCFTKNMANAGITHPQLAVMMVVRLREGLEQKEVAEISHHDYATLGGISRRLEKAGLLERRRSKRSKRGQTLHLTDEGRRFMEQIEPNIRQVQEDILHPLSKDEQALLLSLLSRMAGVQNSWTQGE